MTKQIAGTEVFALWLNYGLLGLFEKEEKALEQLELYKVNLGRPDTWEQLPGGRWHQRNGPVARLEVKAVEIQ